MSISGHVKVNETSFVAFFSKKERIIWRTLVLFVGVLVTSALGFKAGTLLACMFHHLHAKDSSDSPLVRHLLTCWQSLVAFLVSANSLICTTL